MRRFLRMAAHDRKLLLGAVYWLFAYGALLRILPTRTLRESLNVRGRYGEHAPASVDRVAWAVKLASCYVPHNTCLTRGLTALRLLRRQGLSAELRIGVRRNAGGEFEAHAWVESDGRVVTGELKDLPQFLPLRSIMAALPSCSV